MNLNNSLHYSRDKLPFQQAINPTNNLLGLSICPGCHSPVPVNISQWNGSDLICTRCGLITNYNFQTARTEITANQLITDDLFPELN